MLRHWRQYLFQMLIAWAASFIVLAILDMRHEVIIASIGATAFIMFAKPHAPTAQPRHVILGQLMGITAGLAWTFVPRECYLMEVAVYSGSVITCFALMVLTDTDHPPAAGTALGITIAGTFSGIVLILLGVVGLLVGTHYFLRKRMIDLL